MVTTLQQLRDRFKQEGTEYIPDLIYELRDESKLPCKSLLTVQDVETAFSLFVDEFEADLCLVWQDDCFRVAGNLDMETELTSLPTTTYHLLYLLCDLHSKIRTEFDWLDWE